MAVELKDVIQSLGIDTDIEKLTIDEFKTAVGTKYVLREEVLKDEEIKKKFVGNVFGKLNTKTAQLFGLKSSEVDGKDFEEILGGIKTKYDVQIKDLTTKAGEGSDKKVKDLEALLAERDVKLATAESGLTTWETKFNTEVADREGKLKTYKLNDKINKVQNSLSDKFTEEYKKNELVRAGFESHINNTYMFDLDDKDEPIVKLKSDGSVVKSKLKIGHTATPDEIWMIEMDAKGVLKKNNASDKKIITTFVPKDSSEKSKVHPNAQKALERLSSK